MSYSFEDFKYYSKYPKKITPDLDEELLLALVDVDSSWMGYMRPHTLDFIEKAAAVDPTTFEYADRSVLSIQFLEEMIAKYPILIKHVYSPSDDLIKLALNSDMSIINYIDKNTLPETLIKWVVSRKGIYLKYIPKSLQTEEIVRLAIEEDYNAYKYAYIKNKDFDIYVVKKDYRMVKYITDYHDEIINEVLEFNGYLIHQYLDKPILTDEIIMNLIDKDSKYFKVIPQPSLDVIKFAVLKDLTLLNSIDYNIDLLDYVLEYNGLVLKYYKKKDLNTILKAIEQNVLALDYIENPRTILREYAFELDGIGVKYLENPTIEQYTDAIKRNVEVIKFIPDEFQTEAIQLSALSGYGSKAVPYILNPKTDDVIYEMLRQEPGYIFKINNPTDEMFIITFSSNGSMILFFDNWEDRFSDEVKEAALMNEGSILSKFNVITKSYVYAAINSYPACIQWVDFQDIDIAKAAVNKDPKVLFFVDREIMDEELLDLALELDPDFFKRTAGEITYEEWLELINQN